MWIINQMKPPASRIITALPIRRHSLKTLLKKLQLQNCHCKPCNPGIVTRNLFYITLELSPARPPERAPLNWPPAGSLTTAPRAGFPYNGPKRSPPGTSPAPASERQNQRPASRPALQVPAFDLKNPASRLQRPESGLKVPAPSRRFSSIQDDDKIIS